METGKRGGGLKDGGDQGREVIGVFEVLFPSLGAMAYHINWDSTAEARQRRERRKQTREAGWGPNSR